MKRLLLALLVALGTARAAEPYFPPRHDWARCDPCHLDAAQLAAAARELQNNENTTPRDQSIAWAQSFGSREPYFGGLLGPMAARGPLSGLVIYRGKVEASFGEPDRVDMSHSITKSFLSAVVGLAVQQERIQSVDEPVVRSMPRDIVDQFFASPKNAAISWRHLLQQTSDWQGTLWGRPDWADRPTGATPEDWPKVARHAPGAVHEYNDVRINLLALATLQVLRRPLPEVLREQLMEPIGASMTWRWLGYDNSWVELDGQRMQSVSGGGHWGGGMFINAWDMARFGYLYLRGGRWGARQLVDPGWIADSATPSMPNPGYGYANWFLNRGDKKALPSAPATAVIHRGNGQNIIYVDADNDLLVVLRWVKDDAAIDAFVKALLAARR
jgi:CubicO group peptidase (beta-lactamase class C family)